ncbi:hypothetical protein ACFYS7_40970 [Streptomyces avermitilis]|uniref:hypothetical protein n=1 Tax=Streptomyces avermitilis TaxID=33903 RepID=UPI003691E86F
MVTNPKIIGTIPITARLPYGTRSQLKHLQPFFKAEAARASALPMAPVKGLSRQAAASRRSRWKQEMQQLRRAGELLTFSGCLRVVTLGDPCGMPVLCGTRMVGA